MRGIVRASSGAVIEQLKPLKLLDEPSQAFLREGLTEPILDPATDGIERREPVKLLRDEMFHLAETEESASGWIFDDDSPVIPGRLRPDNEVATQFRCCCHFSRPERLSL
jgi:hypothetical protein